MPTQFPESIFGTNVTRSPLAGQENPILARGFVADTLIAVPKGFRPVDQIAVGDLVETLDCGPQSVRAVRRQLVAGHGDAAPVLFEAGSIGNERPIMVSPNHRILINDWRAELWMGCDEMLVSAKDLVNGRDVRVIEGGLTAFVSLSFDESQIIYAGGCPFECRAEDEAEDMMFPRTAAAFPEVACLMAA